MGVIQTLRGGSDLKGGGLFRLFGLFGPRLKRKYSVFDDGLCHRPGALPRPHSRQRPTGRVKNREIGEILENFANSEVPQNHGTADTDGAVLLNASFTICT